LASIVIVAYGSVTNRARSTKSTTTASTLVKKLEDYNAEVGNYPATYSLLTGAATTATYYIPSGSFSLKTTAIASTDSEIQFNYESCTGGGYRVSTWDYANNTQYRKYLGACTSASTPFTLITS